jgi:hypothetical protein
MKRKDIKKQLYAMFDTENVKNIILSYNTLRNLLD